MTLDRISCWGRKYAEKDVIRPTDRLNRGQHKTIMKLITVLGRDRECSILSKCTLKNLGEKGQDAKVCELGGEGQVQARERGVRTRHPKSEAPWSTH